MEATTENNPFKPAVTGVHDIFASKISDALSHGIHGEMNPALQLATRWITYHRGTSWFKYVLLAEYMKPSSGGGNHLVLPRSLEHA